jgi:hypothetical protein
MSQVNERGGYIRSQAQEPPHGLVRASVAADTTQPFRHYSSSNPTKSQAGAADLPLSTCHLVKDQST